MLESLASLPDDLRGVVNREELNQIQSELSREIDLLETSNQKTDQLKRQLDRVGFARAAIGSGALWVAGARGVPSCC